MYVREPTYNTGLKGFLSANAITLHSHHHNQYAKNLSALIKNTSYEGMPLDNIVSISAPNDTEYQTSKRSPIYTNAAQVRNHNLFFEQFNTKPTKISSEFEQIIINQFGSMSEFKTSIVKKSASLFGSGWVWLALTYHTNWTSPSLRILSTKDGDTIIPLLHKEYVTHPIFVVDLWEHSYYPDYNYDRKRYVHNVWDYVDWSVIESRYNSTIATITDYTQSFEL